MRIVVGAECTPIRAGIEARSPELRVCGHGVSRKEALDSLERAIRAYALGFQLAGPEVLARVFNSSGLAWSSEGEAIEIEIEDV